MADKISVSVPSHPLPSISTPSSFSSNSIPPAPTTANLFQTTTLSPSTPTQTTSPHDNRPAPSQQNGLPLVPIIGAGAVLLILFAVGVWYFLRRRRQRRKETKSGFSIVFPDRKGSSQFAHDRQRRSRSQARNSNNSNKVGDEQPRISVDSFPGRSFPGDQSSIHDDSHNIDIEMALPLHNSTLPFPESPYSRPRQPPIIPVNPRSQPPTPAPVSPPRSISIPMPETTTSSPVEEEEELSEKPNHIHIDMTDMPVVGSVEIKPVVQPSSQQEQVAQEHKPESSPAYTQSSASAATETEEVPRESTDTIMPMPVPRRPKLTVQNSSDSFIQGGRARISIACHPPPPPPTIPPPAIPPPAIPSGQEQGRVSTESSYQSSMYSTSNQSAGGRRPRTPTESSRIPCSRRSVSMDATSFTADGRRLSRKLIPPPNMPPPPIPLPPTPSPSLTPISSTPHQAPRRQRHQRNPSQTLNTSLFDSSDRSAISPPLSPLTIQIPRPSSRSFQSLLTINTQLTAENVQQYLQQQQPQPLEIYKPDSPTDSIFAVSPRTSSLHHIPRSRSRSATQLETQRIMIPPSPVNATAFGAASPAFSPPMPPVPAMPSSLADHLPLSSPRSTSSQSYIAFKRPSLSHQQSSSSLDNPRIDATASGSTRHNQYHYGADDNGHHDYQHYERGAHSPEPKKRHHQKLYRRRSMSAPTSPSSPSSPSSSCQRERDSSTSFSSGRRSKEESVRASATATPISTKDQELQAIIADAIAIAAAKTAAIETVRQNNFSRQLRAKQQQHQQYLQQHHQYQQHQYQQRRGVLPQIDLWRSATPSTADSSRPGSPL